MNSGEVFIRVAAEEDAEELLAIYRPYVEKTAITFEYEVPGVEAFRGRIRDTLKKYPYLVAERAGELLGYAYTGPFVGRAAYGWGAETSIYLREDLRKLGLGKRLYAAIEAVSRAQNILNLNACIGSPERDDGHLDHNSVEFHAHMGYETVGEFHKCGYKFGVWYNMVWMEKMLGEHRPDPLPVVPFSELKGEILAELGVSWPGRVEENHIFCMKSQKNSHNA